MLTADELKKRYPQKIASSDDIFGKIKAGDRIFISTGCGEPQHLVKTLVQYVESNPKAFFDTEILHVWSLGVAPYGDAKLKSNFRQNSFFISRHTRQAVNNGEADYTPILLSEVPALFRLRQVPVDVALIQVSPPDEHGYCSLGISLDITRAAVESADTVIAQINAEMPRVHGNTFLHVEEIDNFIWHDEPLLVYPPSLLEEEIAENIGHYVARIVEDGDTIQVGYGGVLNTIVAALSEKKHLGVHTELLSDGLVELLKSGAVDNSRKERNRGKTVASFCMGSRETYDYVNDNPAILFREIDYTNDPLVIAAHDHMTAINSALEIDLTGQASAESIGSTFYSGVGGQANFMRGAVLAAKGKNILVLQSTSRDGKSSRIVPALAEGAGVTLARGDLHYVVTEYGIAHLHGRNIRERAMSLIAIAHPQFQPWLIDEAKKRKLIYGDQAYLPGEKGEYPSHLETYRTTKHNQRILLRPVKISDEPLIKEFHYSLSDKSIYRRFMSVRRYLPHEELQKHYVVIDYTREMVILAIIEQEGREKVVGMAQYSLMEDTMSAEVSVVVRDDYQKMGIGFEMLSHMITNAKSEGLHTVVADILPDNTAVFHLIEKLGLKYERKWESGVIRLSISMKDIAGYSGEKNTRRPAEEG
ncbi:MAG: GNAT family N-acetyltransferase [Bacillota bacterium]|nr:GNAT family N-acetyltransferase [Bacillota bacterium]